MLLLADVFENFRNMWLDHNRFLTAPGSAWQAALKNTKVKIDLLTDINIIINKHNQKLISILENQKI